MINALPYEPQGQRFEPRQHKARGQRRVRHIHLTLHLHLTLGARRMHAPRFWQPTAARVTIIFAAFMGALSMVLSFTFLSGGSYSFRGPHIDLANNLTFLGALLGLIAVLLGGLPLAIAAWRSTPRSRLLLLAPALAILTPFIFLPIAYMFGFINMPLLLAELLVVAAIWRPTWRKRVFYALLSLFLLTMPLVWLFFHNLREGFLYFNVGRWLNVNGDTVFAFLLYAVPLVVTIAIVRAIRRARPSDQWLRLLRFTRIPSLLVVVSIFLMLAGLLMWGGTVLYFLPGVFPQLLALLALPFHSWLLEILGMLIALVVALVALFSDVRSRERAHARPKDASPVDVDPPEEPRDYRGYRGW